MRTVRTVQVIEGKRRLLPKMENGEPVTELVASEPIRITRGELNGHFCRDSGRKLVVALRDGDLLELRPRGRRQGAYTASLFDIYSWMIKSAADKAKMQKLRDIKAKKEDRRRERALRRPIRE